MFRRPLCVELLEDRCTPSADALLQTVAVEPVMVQSPETYVIDPPLIDPSVPPQTSPPQSSTAPLPLDLIPPIALPFWY